MKLSLRMRVLLIVSSINLAVFGLGFAFGARDLDEQLRAEYQQSLFYRLQSTVDPQGELNVATILQWPSWKYFDDALIVHANLVEDEKGEIRPHGAFLNPLGQARRLSTFDLQRVLHDIARAIDKETRLPSYGGIVMPIFDPKGGVWGGCWFSLAGFQGTALVWRLLPWFAFSTILLTFATFWVLRRFVLDPVEKLAVGAQRVAAGELSLRIPDPGRDDELASLIRTFNAMTEKIEGYNARLARDVEAATEHVRRAEGAAMTQRRLAATGELAAGIAHEINNPLGGLLNAVESLERGDLPPERRIQYFVLLKSGLERIQSTVGQLLRFTPRTSKPAPMSLVQPVSDAIALVLHRAHDLGVEVHLHPENAPELTGDAARERLAGLPPVLGQANELGQAVLNLLVNALDALDPHSGGGGGGGKARGRKGGRIDVSIGVDGEVLRLVIADDGPGVLPAELPRIADLFYTTKEVGKGTGLGLGIVHSVVAAHGGSVQLSSTPGRGFRVEIRLPIWRPSAPGPGSIVDSRGEPGSGA